MNGEAGETAVGLTCADPIISRLMAYCEQEEVQRSHAQFCREHVHAFHGFHAGQDDEKSHAIHDLFLKYERHFEAMLQGFLDAEQMTPDTFYTHCRRLRRHVERECKSDDDGSSENALLNLRVVLSALDFESFCELMEREAIATQRALKHAEDMGL